MLRSLNKKLNLNKKGSVEFGEMIILLLFVLSIISIVIVFFVAVFMFNYDVELHVADQRAQEVALRIAQNPWPCLAYKDPKTSRLYPYILNESALTSDEDTKKFNISNCADIPHTSCSVNIYELRSDVESAKDTINVLLAVNPITRPLVVYTIVSPNKYYFLPVGIRHSDKDIRLGGMEVRCDLN
ncbi:MAG: hypothetical protein CVU81_02880 [Euryarchaeota archaeon HGW-Euryarchaeota-1]|nr:MAG: hypothetical protein CVU81_02880 [Euryarchaeota archaeon HGW-Euryarchaeota-1]